MDYSIDITKDRCPMTFVKVKVQLAKMNKGDRLKVLLSGGEPLKNVPRSAKEQGYKVLEVKQVREFHQILIEK